MPGSRFLRGLACPRCRATFGVEPRFDGCPRCGRAVPVNLVPLYDEAAQRAAFCRDALADRPPSMWRYEELLPVAAADAVSLHEGFTPLVPCPRLGERLGVPRLWLKDESRNPTWSFKDRLAAVAVSMARGFGARVIACSSSGNAGAAAAAYAARAGLPCVVLTFEGSAGAMMTQMRAYGAMVVATRDKADRWRLLERCVRELGWYPTSPYFGPPVGSNAYGVDGYKTLAYEVVEQLGWRAPDWCVLPVAYGDGLAGMARGFEDLHRLGLIPTLPRLVAAEIFGSLAAADKAGADAVAAVEKDHETVAVSIGTLQSTWQALHALRRTRGCGVRVGDADLLALQAEAAAAEGVYAEPSSVAPLAAVRALRRDGVIADGDTVVALVTATGLKDTEATARRAGAIPVIGGEIGALFDTLRSVYGFRAAP
jgi:threonine synthase